MGDNKFLDLIKANITKHGYHVTIVNSDTDPRYCYTIGLNESLGFELVIAGGYFYLKDDLLYILDLLVSNLKKDGSLINSHIQTSKFGSFTFIRIHDSWNDLMLLGVSDYYKTDTIKSFQIIPDGEHFTLEIPDMSKKINGESFPIWKWLIHEWDLKVPETSKAITNLAALKGEKITEVMRWEVDNWEMFAGSGPDIDENDIRVVPIGMILGIDKTINDALDLKIEKGFWRKNDDLVLHDWG
ncbi:MAG: hypothetical protein A3D31_12105 [Candidatus Fluviicola riflensis]|nr:MAG: hypothetical protein CHH17_16540 [Candidatus Fluviicola riflensis]OGS77728.1 MAG: hypothetical protein A3D31_12105 [Candidatus Fluviicola riflensis]OGS84311.1 MAG: hypothetical protein A3E30_13515 [Fluviicola sp. RIFCSPHIGHO2_12_FULL_43_24]OGS84794.1 MAG: hypothetical protein A2724_09040 [Fluviicola sp. RIFCSPHIGHO2_01_FULL_43_53]